MRHSKIPHKRRRHKTQHSSIFWRKLLFGGIVVMFIAGFGYVMLMLPIAQIQHIEVSSTQRIAPDDVVRATQEFMRGMVAQRIARSQYVLVRTDQLAQQLQQQFGAIKDITVRKQFPDTIVIDITEWEHVFLWCRDGTAQCFLLRDNGVLGPAIAPESVVVQDNDVTRIVDTSNREVHEGEQILEVRDAQFIYQVAQKLHDAQIAVRTDIFETPARISRELYLTLQSGGRLLLSMDQSLDTIVNVARAVMQREITSEKYSQIEYIDLRVNNKAFYQLKSASPQSVAESDTK